LTARLDQEVNNTNIERVQMRAEVKWLKERSERFEKQVGAHSSDVLKLSRRTKDLKDRVEESQRFLDTLRKSEDDLKKNYQHALQSWAVQIEKETRASSLADCQTHLKMEAQRIEDVCVFRAEKRFQKAIDDNMMLIPPKKHLEIQTEKVRQVSRAQSRQDSFIAVKKE
jgi:predicted RNase H-like nuclease (RuvC/YqgF family)